MFDRLSESSHRDDSNKWSNIGFTKEIIEVVPINNSNETIEIFASSAFQN